MSEQDIHPSASLQDNVKILGEARLAAGVEIGPNVTIYPNVDIGENVKILAGAVIGRPPLPTGSITRKIDLGTEETVIGANSVIGANAVLYTDVHLGEDVLIGDLATVREGSRLSEGVVVGRSTTVSHNVTMLARSRLHELVHLTGHTYIEEDVFFGATVSTVNDNDVFLTRYGLIPYAHKAPTVRRFAVVGSGATLGSGVEIGMGGIVAPGALAVKDVPPWTVVVGVPAREVRKIDEDMRLQVLQHFGLDPADTP